MEQTLAVLPDAEPYPPGMDWLAALADPAVNGSASTAAPRRREASTGAFWPWQRACRAIPASPEGPPAGHFASLSGTRAVGHSTMVQTVSPLPVHGDVIVGQDAVGKILRVSRHSELDRVVLSIWDGARCVATLRLATGDVPELVRVLVGTLVEEGAPAVAAVGPAGDPPHREQPWERARRWADRAGVEVRRRLVRGAST